MGPKRKVPPILWTQEQGLLSFYRTRSRVPTFLWAQKQRSPYFMGPETESHSDSEGRIWTIRVAIGQWGSHAFGQ